MLYSYAYVQVKNVTRVKWSLYIYICTCSVCH